MRPSTGLALLPVGIVVGSGLMLLRGLPAPARPDVTRASQADQPLGDPAGGSWQARGTTKPAPGRRGIIAPVPLHPVIEVKVKPGDRVKKGQVLVKLDDDEPRADVRARKAALAELKATVARLKAHPREEERAEVQAALEAAKVSAGQANALLRRMTPAFESGAIPEARFSETRATLLKLEADERAAVARLQQLLKKPWKLEVAEAEARVEAAQAALESSEAELEHYTVTAPLEGVVSRLDVHLGTVSRPGTTVWGEILDLGEVDVQCDLTPGQAARVAVGDSAVVRQDGSEAPWEGRVVFVGVAADPRSGRVPVRVRVVNPGGRLRCYTEAVVTFGDKERPDGWDGRGRRPPRRPRG